MENFTRRPWVGALAAGIAILASPGKASADGGNLGLVATGSPEAQTGWIGVRELDSADAVQFVRSAARDHIRIVAEPRTRLALTAGCPDPELKWSGEAGTKPVPGGPTGKLSDRGEGIFEVEMTAPRREGDSRGGKLVCKDTKNPNSRRAQKELTFDVSAGRTKLPTLPLVPVVSALEFDKEHGLPAGDFSAAFRGPELGGQFGLNFDALNGTDPRFGLSVGPEVAFERLPQNLTDGISENAKGLHVRGSLLAQMKFKFSEWLTAALGGGAGVCHTPAVRSETGARAAAETEGCFTGTASLEAGKDFGVKAGTDVTRLGNGNNVWQTFVGLFGRFGTHK